MMIVALIGVGVDCLDVRRVPPSCCPSNVNPITGLAFASSLDGVRALPGNSMKRDLGIC